MPQMNLEILALAADEQTSPLLSSEWLKLDCVGNGTHFFQYTPILIEKMVWRLIFFVRL
jgi:hypothetical protein